jgi:hypothetical protein
MGSPQPSSRDTVPLNGEKFSLLNLKTYGNKMMLNIFVVEYMIIEPLKKVEENNS